MSSYSPPLHINPKFNATDYNYQDKYMTQYTADLRYAQTAGDNAFSGTNTFVTQNLNDTTTKAATTEFVNNSFNALNPILTNFTTKVNTASATSNQVASTGTQNKNAGLTPVIGNSGNVLVYTIVLPTNFSNTISISSPILVVNSAGSFLTGITAPFNTTFANTISTYKFVIYKNGVLWATNTAVAATGAKQTNTTTISANTALNNYTFNDQQYFGNYTTSFTPDNTNTIDTYSVYFSTNLTIQASVQTGIASFSVTGYIVANSTVSTHTSSITGAGTSSLTLTADATGYAALNYTYTGALPTNTQSGYTYVDSINANAATMKTLSCTTSLSSPTISATTSLSSPSISATTLTCNGLQMNGLINGSFSTGATGNNGTGIMWNGQGGSGGSDFYNFAQGGTGGFFYYIVNAFHGSSFVAYIDSGGSFHTQSDYRIKSHVKGLDSSISVLPLRPVSYVNDRTKQACIGFIAHELQNHFPNLVSGEKDAEVIQTVNYAGLVPILVNDIQRLQAEMNVLKEQMARILSV